MTPIMQDILAKANKLGKDGLRKRGIEISNFENLEEELKQIMTSTGGVEKINKLMKLQVSEIFDDVVSVMDGGLGKGLLGLKLNNGDAYDFKIYASAALLEDAVKLLPYNWDDIADTEHFFKIKGDSNEDFLFIVRPKRSTRWSVFYLVDEGSTQRPLQIALMRAKRENQKLIHGGQSC